MGPHDRRVYAIRGRRDSRYAAMEHARRPGEFRIHVDQAFEAKYMVRECRLLYVCMERSPGGIPLRLHGRIHAAIEAEQYGDQRRGYPRVFGVRCVFLSELGIRQL